MISYERRPSATALAAAARDLSAAIALSPVAKRPFVARAHVYATQGRTRAALRDLETVLQREPKSIPALMERGQLFLGSLHQPQNAITDFSVVIAADNRNAAAHLGRGRGWWLIGNAGMARRDFILAREFAPDPAARNVAYGALAALDRNERTSPVH